ncbi:RagB/SusD family nutrient uptake outer membrane protein [Aridibaculum aurantiacum]|uniref:RagB/SusD family nutrient uptake outer membrane protein n=1 Tax=Aridibaculum aurantiacum TaxID=2810307 RepID=UPI001A965FEA|nr:RagB/SusD family nutrient uptake outer membrane protein [Aridibaculum aurantiacum]
MKFLKLFSTAFLVLTLFSCKKLLEVPETDNIGGDIALRTVSNNESAIMGAYTQLNPEMAILLNSTFSDEVKVGEFYNAATTHEWQFATQDVTIRDNFNAMVVLYRAVDRANRVIQALPNATALKASDEATRSRVLGEAYFVRAYAHFELVRYYSGNYDPNGLAMTYMESPTLLPQTRITQGPYYQKIIADINAAKPLLPNNQNDIYRANRSAAVGLHARVALYMRDWATAAAQATEYINALPLASRTAFPGIWQDVNNTEVAFKLARTAQIGGRVGSLFRGTSANSTNIGTITWSPSDKIWNAYDQTNDIRFPTYFKVEPILVAANRPARLINKYAGGSYGSPNENVADIKVFRTGEMILIRAEARAEQNDLAGAAADVNALRNARITGHTNVTYATRDAAINDILLERFRELPYEGHRFWDLRRKNMPVERLASDAPSATSQTLPAGHFRFVMPIPQTEIQANPAYQQNPGY